MNLTECTEEIMRDHLKNDGLFIDEKYITALPLDWFDAVSFIYTNGVDQNKDRFLITMEDEETERFFRVTSKESIHLFVRSEREIEGRRYFWNCIIRKEIVDNNLEPQMLLIGAETFRDFCDLHDLFYKTIKTQDGRIISASQLKYLKHPGEDCRKIDNS